MTSRHFVTPNKAKGDKTLVEITVAIALGASVKPFANSAARTTNNTTVKDKFMANSSSQIDLWDRFGLEAQAYFRATPSSTLATSSQLSRALSI